MMEYNDSDQIKYLLKIETALEALSDLRKDVFDKDESSIVSLECMLSVTQESIKSGKYDKKFGLKSETDSCSYFISCRSCNAGNYVSTNEERCFSWNCWACNAYLVTIVGGKREAAGENDDKEMGI